MTTTDDPFGDAYRCVHESGARPGVTHLVYEMDDGYIYAEDAVNYFHGPDTWLPVDRMACEYATGRILDIGCGPGRHSSVLARAGKDVVGIDTSRGGVEVARLRGVEAHVASVAELPDDLGTFDTFLMLGANLGLLGDQEHSRGVLEGLARHARPGARLLGTNMAFAEAAGADPLAPQGVHTARAHSGEEFVRMRVRHRTAATEWFDFLFCPPGRLDEVTHGTPWTVHAVHQDDSTAWPTYLADLRLEG
ncbi:class I SAM-dependent methyltransferase [Streptomyces albireticuli]|uniref:SAM-dependent methyltransferase n=1 Tax=Streptomyces albireticuli TaxID=1940 RepID=A0A2A2DBH2_9ACTN|nr:class I SAM-dependent methyltransferase [Streptomyces albireticuli]MCD9145069.1 class I SAM-dependent methyltransferase [Streptomyces albireticuli]MCD9164495.1 class I SAM-dependent methyltransferase [Streptomyces albireticuli]MCD9194206.1 class I SAM-dependent methyltransferase [Streptomyces albireticuli]PAU48874.1 SAM-dependent methyltransferase [Streptomyces albireticuli]